MPATPAPRPRLARLHGGIHQVFRQAAQEVVKVGGQHLPLASSAGARLGRALAEAAGGGGGGARAWRDGTERQEQQHGCPAVRHDGQVRWPTVNNSEHKRRRAGGAQGTDDVRTASGGAAEVA